MSYEQIMLQRYKMHELSCAAASFLHYILKKSKEVSAVVVVGKYHEDNSCFRVKLKQPVRGVHEIEISCYSDSYELYTPVIKLALIDANKCVCYDEELGYGNVKQFDSVDQDEQDKQDLQEIQRICRA